MAATKTEHLTRGGLAVALCVVVLAAGFGAGYRSSQAVLSHGTAYLQVGHNVARVNADNRQIDAETDAARKLATGRERLEVVQVSPDAVYVINHETGAVYRLPTDTMDPKLLEQRKGSRKQLHVVSGGKRTFLVDSKQGRLTELDERTGTRRGDVPTPAPVQFAVVDSRGTAWALSRTAGELYVIVGGTVQAKHPVSARNEPATLTLAGDRPVVFRPGKGGSAVMYGREGVVRRIDTNLEDPVVVSRAGADAPTLALVQRSDARLVTVDFTSGDVEQLHLARREGHDFGPPVVFGKRLYVPDYTGRHVVVVELPSLRVLAAESVRGRGTFDVFARDGRVWVNEPYERYMFSFDAKGRRSDIDRGKRDGVEDRSEPEPQPSDPPESAGPPAAPRPNLSKPPANTRPRRSSPPAPRLVTVPNVVGMDITQACRAITQAGLACAPVAKSDGGGTTGQALSTDPPAGSKLRAGAGSKVTVFYRGPQQVPNVVGMPTDQACRALQEAALQCQGSVSAPAQTAAEVGKVTSQQPAPLSEVPTGSNVTIIYPEAVAVPDLMNVDPGTACARIQAAGLACGPEPEEVTWQANVVHSQNPPPNTAAGPGARIAYVYQDTPPVPLHRFKKSGQNARFLSPGGGAPPGGWTLQNPMGGVYGPGGGVPGLVQVFQFHCSGDCGTNTTEAYYYKASSTPPESGLWTLQGPAFSCFGSAGAGTRPLYKMRRAQDSTWAFAPEGTGEFNEHVQHGYVPNGPPICHIWYGVPGLP